MLLLVPAALAQPAYVQTPDLHGDTAVFATGGDLWLADVTTGAAHPLTAHPGVESSPQFSPDGKWVAYSGMYDGNVDVFAIPVEGGEPVRLTWHPAAETVVGFTPKGDVLFRSSALQPNGSAEMWTVPVTGGEPTRLPIGFAARLAVDPDSGRYLFERLGYEFRTWKRYRGGRAGDLWIGDPATNDFRQLTDTPFGENFPMWWGGRVWYLSDQGGTADLWSSKPDGTDPRRQTDSGEWDARTPSMGSDGRVIYTRAGDLMVYDPDTDASTKVPLQVRAERANTRPRHPWAMRDTTWWTLSPEGDRLMVVARGEAFAVPVEDGPALPITRSSGARESWVSFSPDGKRVVYVTDESGEEAIVTADAWGRGDVKTVVPAATSGWHFWPLWSPDGKRIAYADQTQTLYVVAADGSSAPKAVDRGTQQEIRDYVWAPGGRYLAYTKDQRPGYTAVFVWDSKDGVVHQVSGASTSDHSPAWDPQGRYLYWVSERATNPHLGNRDFQVVEHDTGQLVMWLLRDDVEDPFAKDAGLPGAEPPVVVEAKRKKRQRQKEEGDLDTEAESFQISWTNVHDRQIVLPVPHGTYWQLAATDSALFFLAGADTGFLDAGGSWLSAFDLDEEEVSQVASGVGGFELSGNREKLVLAKPEGWYVVDAAAGPADLSDTLVDTSGVVIDLDPREEWRQIYFEAWRLMRDFFWDRDLGGLEWTSIRDQYATLLDRLSSRSELNDLLGELIGELGTSHTYTWGGDGYLRIDWQPAGLLGAELVREGAAYRVAHIWRGDPADGVESPLLRPGHVVKEGEYIVGVQNRPLREGRPLWAELEGRANVPVVLNVNARPTFQGSRAVVVTPLEDDRPLLYADWVRRNREYVAEKTGGKMGYLHIPDMGTRGLTTFETWYYPQLDKEGLVVDVRWNGGGWASQLMLQRLQRRVFGFDRAAGGGVTPFPSGALNGPFVVITNEFAGSDGDIFPKSVQELELAPIVGERSWGGVIGIRGDKPLVDGGFLSQPEYASWFANGGWGLENHGVDPDVEVQNLPQDLGAGRDPQLDRAIAELLRLHQEHPPLRPSFEDEPTKTRDAFRKELP